MPKDHTPKFETIKKMQHELKTPKNLFFIPLSKPLAIIPINTTLPHVKIKVERTLLDL